VSPAPPVPVIFNPSARSAQAESRIDELKALSDRIVLHPTSQAGDARDIAASLAAAGAPIIVAAGGDGTVNEVVNGIASAGPSCPSALGLLPSGTMNVFAMDLGLPSDQMDECWAVIERGISRSIDLWRANDSYFVQLAGAGLDASIIASTTWESKKKLGPLSYLLSGLRTLQQPAPLLTIRAPGRDPITGTVALIGNGRSYGGPFRLFPDASFDDGKLDVVVMKYHGIAEFLKLSLSVMSGQFATDGSVLTFQTPELTISAEGHVPFEADGELSGSVPVHIRHAGFPLRVLV
jgi:YegS/Rv2252/BmrU family lipid kinase